MARKSGKPNAQRATAALQSSRTSRSWGVPLAVVVVVLFAAIVAGGLYLAQREASNFAVPPQATPTGVILGQADAPVTVHLYEDFQCPVCQRFEQLVGDTIDQLVASGKIKAYYHPIAILDDASTTNYSTRAAAASGCAAGVFDRYAELLYANQPPEGGDGLTEQRLVELGRKAGATGEQFAQCVKSQRYSDWVEHITTVAAQRGVTATPTVIIDGEQLSIGKIFRSPTPGKVLRQAVQQAA